MQFPFLIELGAYKIPLHIICETGGMFIGFRYFLFLRKQRGDAIESSNRVWIIVGSIFGALIGSRLIGALENPIAWREAESPLLYLYQNKTVVGGFLGGLMGVELMKKRIGEPTASGDLFVYPILLALIIGRIGCFSMGIYEETYGLPTSLPWGMDLGDHINRHPVMLYEIFFLLTLWLCLSCVKKKVELQNGALFKLFMIAYLCFRFLIDFIKPHYSFYFGLSTIQLVSIAGLIYYLPYLIQPKKLTSAYA